MAAEKKTNFIVAAYGNLMCETHLEAAFSFGDILLRVEEDDVDFGHIEHPQRHGGRQAERDSQGGSLDIHLWRETERRSHLSHLTMSEAVCVIVRLQIMSDEGQRRMTDGTKRETARKRMVYE